MQNIAMKPTTKTLTQFNAYTKKLVRLLTPINLCLMLFTVP